MHTRIGRSRSGLGWAMAALLVAVGGCSTSTDMNGVHVPNAAPDTRVTGQPPTLLEASYAVAFSWTGTDADGRLKGFQWKLSDNGTDGISPQDTLTVDPLTGAVLHPWRFTAATDSTFIVLADQADFPGDDVAPRSFRSHSLFVRAMDEDGSVDPTPAYISFTSTTIAPTAGAVFPLLAGSSAVNVPPTVNIGWKGNDPDFDSRAPVRARYLWIPARTEGGVNISNSYQYNLFYHELLSFDDPRWSPWLPYAPDPEDRIVSIPSKNYPNEYFLFATQVQDTAGAVSVGMGYQMEVANVVIRQGQYRPRWNVVEAYLGAQTGLDREDLLAGGQPLNFSWTVSAAGYNGNIVSLRHGWDIVDAADENDPGWAVPPGLGPQNLKAAERSFNDGLHTFVLKIVDDSEQEFVVRWKLRVIPFVDRDFQLPLLVLDQVDDRNSNAWFSRDARPLNEQQYRNAYWHFLGEGAGGVADLNWDRDWKDISALVTYEDIVGYKAVLCYAQYSLAQTIFQNFRPAGSEERYVWLAPYQRQGGNLMLVGARSMESFIKFNASFMVPMVFDAREETYPIFGRSYTVGFGDIELPDGTEVQRGPRMYPYATAGITMLDWTSPNRNIYGRQVTASEDRNRLCAGLKGLVLAPAFKDNHLIGPGVVPDTIYTDLEIDWRDNDARIAGNLNLLDQAAFLWDADEFIDANISSRLVTTPPQECNGETYQTSSVPNGLCIEPMFTGISRLDWIREQKEARGDANWPRSQYTQNQLSQGCGPLGLTDYEGRPQASARTNGKVFGYASYKSVPTKQWKAPDIYWGFDPYRFNHEDTRRTIRWVLQELFNLQINQ